MCTFFSTPIKVNATGGILSLPLIAGVSSSTIASFATLVAPYILVGVSAVAVGMGLYYLINNVIASTPTTVIEETVSNGQLSNTVKDIIDSYISQSYNSTTQTFTASNSTVLDVAYSNSSNALTRYNNSYSINQIIPFITVVIGTPYVHLDNDTTNYHYSLDELATFYNSTGTYNGTNYGFWYCQDVTFTNTFSNVSYTGTCQLDYDMSSNNSLINVISHFTPLHIYDFGVTRQTGSNGYTKLKYDFRISETPTGSSDFVSLTIGGTGSSYDGFPLIPVGNGSIANPTIGWEYINGSTFSNNGSITSETYTDVDTPTFSNDDEIIYIPINDIATDGVYTMPVDDIASNYNTTDIDTPTTGIDSIVSGISSLVETIIGWLSDIYDAIVGIDLTEKWNDLQDFLDLRFDFNTLFNKYLPSCVANYVIIGFVVILAFWVLRMILGR